VTTAGRERSAWERERSALLARLDSVLVAGDGAVRALEGQREELASALRASQADLRRARAQLESALGSGDEARVEDLRRDVQALTTALERQQLAASLDFDDIEGGSRRAVALVWVESANGDVVTGTAFAVRSDATLLTTRHLIEGVDGRTQVRRIGVQFADSEQVFPARVLGSDPIHDLAVLTLDNVVGAVPVIRGLDPGGEALGTGVPIAVIGFPLGGGAGGSGAPGRTASPLVSSGVISTWESDRVEIFGYGAAGASGSPILDERGRVIAVLFGGTQGPDGQRIFGVPARHALALLSRLP
jgi:S1-C subfamily serine protease